MRKQAGYVTPSVSAATTSHARLPGACGRRASSSRPGRISFDNASSQAAKGSSARRGCRQHRTTAGVARKEMWTSTPVTAGRHVVGAESAASQKTARRRDTCRRARCRGSGMRRAAQWKTWRHGSQPPARRSKGVVAVRRARGSAIRAYGPWSTTGMPPVIRRARALAPSHRRRCGSRSAQRSRETSPDGRADHAGATH